MKKEEIKGIVFIMMGVLSLVLIFPNVTRDLSLESQEYQFMINARNNMGNEEGQIHNLFLEYDFKKNKGSFNFRIFSKTDMSELSVFLPPQIIIENFSVKDKEGNYINKCQLFGGSSSDLSCNNLKGNQSFIFSINITNNPDDPFYPNGNFYFYTPFKGSSVRQILGKHFRSLLFFNFSDKYRCSERCFMGEYGNANLTYSANKNLFEINTLIGDDGYFGMFNRFTINTYNFKKERLSEFWLALGISLLAGLILLIGQEFLPRDK